METTVEKSIIVKYAIPIGTTNLYDIDYAKTLRLLKEVKRRCQSEKSSQRKPYVSIETNTPTIKFNRNASMYIKLS
jgi:hypothetical protein